MKISNSIVQLYSQSKQSLQQQITTVRIDQDSGRQTKGVQNLSHETQTTGEMRSETQIEAGQLQVTRQETEHIISLSDASQGGQLQRNLSIMVDTAIQGLSLMITLKSGTSINQNTSPGGVTLSASRLDPETEGRMILTELQGMSIRSNVSLVQQATRAIGGNIPKPIREEKTIQTSIHQDLALKAEGYIQTEDGKEISFNMHIANHTDMSFENSITTFRVRDPLVLNFNGQSTDLLSSTFVFDLDNDGQEEEVAALGQGSGFLALDINQDGKINNGGELFGPNSGSGFADLNRYDEDNNLWIDENDSIYDKLLVWMKNSDDEGQLLTLREAGVGALHLGSSSLNANIYGDDGGVQGVISKSGIFLSEEGVAHTLQEVNIVV